ncbi:MAG: hypothetical protein M5U34_14145 [Chloroflexi bacterium]|nr:hypothetical protein [Chloroflexota bacterium]
MGIVHGDLVVKNRYEPATFEQIVKVQLLFLAIFYDFAANCTKLTLTAFFVILIPVLFYGKWYDWPGGKAWGPRFLVPTMPALVLLCLPTINWLSASRPKWRRILLAAWLLSSFLAQLPGVLVNFDYQEILDGKKREQPIKICCGTGLFRPCLLTGTKYSLVLPIRYGFILFFGKIQ